MRSLFALVLGAVGTTVAQNVATYCSPENIGVCYSFHVPSSGAFSGPGDIFMQMTAPSTIPWFGLGQSPEGTMEGANIFVVYPNQDGTNVTLSSRAGLGHFPPKPGAAAKLTLLSGSGISNGKMVANIQCSNCNSWKTGQMSLQDAQSMWIYAYGIGMSSSIHTNNAAGPIQFHDGYGSFQVDLSKATGGTESANPFDGRTTPFASTQDSTKKVFYSNMALIQKQNKVRIAHGIMGALAFALIFPIASMLMRMGAFGPERTWKVHAGIQMFGYAMVIAVMGMGIWLARGLHLLDVPHVIIGLVAICGVYIMPFLGLAQHSGFVKTGKRTAWGYIHAHFGRIFVLLGVINAPLGLQYSAMYTPGAVHKGFIAYGVLVGIIGVTWIAMIVITALRRRRASVPAVLAKDSEKSDSDTSG